MVLIFTFTPLFVENVQGIKRVSFVFLFKIHFSRIAAVKTSQNIRNSWGNSNRNISVTVSHANLIRVFEPTTRS